MIRQGDGYSNLRNSIVLAVLSIGALLLVLPQVGCDHAGNAIPPPQRPQSFEPAPPKPLPSPPRPTGTSYSIKGQEYYLLNKAQGYRTSGEASYYGRRFQGRRTASGDRYNMHEYTAAHPTLPFDSLVRVTNLKNKRWVIVRINDRGPFGPGRVIDLSYAAAKTLGMIKAGTARVLVEGLQALDDFKAGTAGTTEPEITTD